MALGKLGGRGGFSKLGALQGASNPYSSYLLYDTFQGSNSDLNGRAPQKGPNWTTSGGAASTMFAGGGVMGQNAFVTSQVGYASAQFGVIPGKLIADWRYLSGTLDYPPILATYPTFVPPGTTLLHGQQDVANFNVSLAASGPTFLAPAWSLKKANYSLSIGHNYRTELHQSGNLAAMVLYDADNAMAVLGAQVAYDPAMSKYIGKYAFWETFNERIRYTRVSAEASATYAFPTLNVLNSETFDSGTGAWVNSALGGSIANSGSGSLVLSMPGSAVGAGGMVPVGALGVGDKLYVSLDILANSGDGMWVLPIDGTTPIGDIQAYTIAAIPDTIPGVKRVQMLLNITTASASAHLAVVASSPSTLTSLTIDNTLVLKNPPTTL